MSLTPQDEQTLQHWFEEKASQPPESDLHIKYRDMIFTHVLEHLGDYFNVLKRDWKKQLYLTEDDCVSIIHDGLLSAITHFNYSHESRNKITKFNTYLTSVLKNLATDYARRMRIRYTGKGENRKERKMRRIPNSYFVSIEDVENILKSDHGNEEAGLFAQLSINDLLKRLSGNDRALVQSILDGETLAEISRRLGVTRPGLMYRLRRIANRFKDME